MGNPLMDKTCVYLSDTDGIHDLRWRTALQSMGWRVDAEVSDSHTPVIAGPLTPGSLSRLDQLRNPVIGLSWGWDLHAAKDHQPADWLDKLSGLIVDSVPTRDIALDLGMNPDLIATIPWGIDLDKFPPRGSDRAVDLSILSLRAHEPLYRIDTILEAVALLQQREVTCSLTIGNDGSLTHKLKRQVKERELRCVSFIGRVQESQLSQLFSQHGIYVSAAETDGTSVTLLQAMATSIPVVVSDSPGNSAWLHSASGPTGMLFELGNPANLAHTLHDMVAHPERVSTMTRNARALVVRDADWSQNIWRLAQLLDLTST